MTPRLAVLAVVFLAACTSSPAAGTSPGVDVPQQQTYSAKGLYTFPNPLSEVPDGAFSRADDVVIRREGMVETRRGFKTAAGTFGSSGDRLSSLSDFAGTLVGQTSANALVRYSGSAWTAYSGTYAEPSAQRMRFLSMANALYFTTSAGVKRLDSATGTPVAAGVPQAVGGTASLTGTTGFLPVNAQTAYRFVWGYRTPSGRIILGAPSGRISVTNPSLDTNPSATPRKVALVVRIPSWVTADYFLQVYRADTSGGESIPAGDDMALAYEAYPTASELAAHSLSITDIQEDALKGAALYSSPNAGVPGSEKFQPPVCTDLAEYKQRAWCAATTQRQRLLITILSVNASSGGLADTQGIIFHSQSPVETRTLTADTVEDQGTDRFKRYTTGTAAQNIADTAQSLVRIINGSTTSNFYAYYVSGEYDSPGQVLLEARALGSGAFTLQTIGGGNWLTPATQGEIFTTLHSRTGSTVTVDTVQPHGFLVGQTINLVQSDNATLFPLGVKTVASVVDADTFTYTEAGTAGTSTGGVFDTIPPRVASDPTDVPNGIAYSEYAEPDAVPLSNYMSAGSANYRVLRLVPLGDSLFIFKEDGIWTLTGDSPETFSLRPFPNPAKLLAPDSVVTLGNSIYALTDQGVMQFSESGAQVISRPIEGDLLPLYSGGATMQATLKTVAFGVAYETEREYHLFLPSVSSDTYATQEYVYNYATRTWVRWTKPATCGYVLPGSDVEYLGKATGNAALVERKTRTLADYQDEDAAAITSAVDWQVRTGGDPSAYKQWQKVTVMVEAGGPSSLTLSLGTELSATRTSGTMTMDGLPYVQSYVPVEQARSQTLTVGVEGGAVSKLLALRGLSVDFIPSSTKLR